MIGNVIGKKEKDRTLQIMGNRAYFLLIILTGFNNILVLNFYVPEKEKGGSFLVAVNVTVNGVTFFIFVFMQSSLIGLNLWQRWVMCSGLRTFTK